MNSHNLIGCAEARSASLANDALPSSAHPMDLAPLQILSAEDHAKNNLPDVLTRWALRDTSERERPSTSQSFCVPKVDIAENGYDLSINRYKEVVHEEVEHLPPKEILAKLAKLEEEIHAGMKALEGMLD
jgi:type I restriction enzyme M protein